MAVSIWYLYVGLFLCCSGFLTPLGIFYVAWWFWNRHEDLEKAKSGFTQKNCGGFNSTDPTSRKTTANKDASSDYFSKETQEENR